MLWIYIFRNCGPCKEDPETPLTQAALPHMPWLLPHDILVPILMVSENLDCFCSDSHSNHFSPLRSVSFMNLTRSPLLAPGGSPCSLDSSYLAPSFCFTGTCESPVCMELVNHYLASGNRSVAPCTDFFSFACEKANGTSNSFQALAEENKSRLWKLLGEDTYWQSL